MALGGRLRIILREYTQDIANAGVSDMVDGQPDFDGRGEAERAGESAAGLDNQPDRVSGDRIEKTLLDQPGVHGGVEPFVIDDIVGVAVGVVVGPAGADLS